jgi:hypothetical protein
VGGGLIEELRIESPKRASHAQGGWEVFFPYYAGFPENFARSLLASAGLPASAVVLDPWNGSGTTTYAASRLGLASCGFDLNPVMVVVARARVLATSEADSIEPLASEVTKHSHTPLKLDKDDPLCRWFGPATAAHIRGIERSIRRHLVGTMTIAPEGLHLDRISGLAATFYVALFAVCRELAGRFQSSNPTWLRYPRDQESRIGTTRASLVDRLTENLKSMAAALVAKGAQPDASRAEQGKSDIKLADTTTVTVDPESADIILTSPPYCTRIDYTAATRIELAVLSPLLDSSTKELARQMIGSICVPSHEIAPSKTWGKTCNAFLKSLRGHNSKASAGYYYRTHLDYFEKMSRSLSILSSALKKNGAAVLVVQDSYYKEIHNDLPKIICEMSEHAGFTLTRVEEYRLRCSMSGINPYSSKYNRPPGATEAVLCFEKQ